MGTGRDGWPVSDPQELRASISQQAGLGRCIFRTPGALQLTEVTGAQTQWGTRVPPGPQPRVQDATLPRGRRRRLALSPDWGCDTLGGARDVLGGA